MSAKAGEVSRETALYRCEDCYHRVVIRAGALINECEKCGNASFQTGWNRSFATSARESAERLFERA